MFRAESHFANGNALDNEGRLLTCEHGRRGISRTDKQGKPRALHIEQAAECIYYPQILSSQQPLSYIQSEACSIFVYIDKPHQGYTIRKAEICTCAMAQCTVVGYLPKETMVKWIKVENSFVNYDSAYYVQFSDIKQLY